MLGSEPVVDGSDDDPEVEGEPGAAPVADRGGADGVAAPWR